MSTTRMDVEIRIPVYEIDGKETGVGKGHVSVSSHWNRTNVLVVLTIEGKSYTVAADAISKAVQRATF